MLHISARQAKERGKNSQRRFFKVAGFMRNRFTPSWFIGVIPADFEYDLRGVDAIAYITYPGETWASRIPIQIKSSWTGYYSYKEKHAKHGAEDVIVAVIRDDSTDEDIRTMLYEELKRIREQNIRFDQYFRELLAYPISRGAECVRQRLIRAKTRQYSARMHRLHLRLQREAAPRAKREAPLLNPPPQRVQEKKRWWQLW